MRLLFEHYKIDPNDKDRWQHLSLKLARAHVPGLQIYLGDRPQKKKGRKRTWKAGLGEELVLAVETIMRETGKEFSNEVILKLQNDNPSAWGRYTAINLETRFREAKREQEQEQNQKIVLGVLTELLGLGTPRPGSDEKK